jgi:hypothetical protein
MRRVLIGTPAHSGSVHCEFQDSLIGTVKMGAQMDTLIAPVQICYEALVQCARNELITMALEGGVDDIVFIDGDQQWNPAWVFKLLNQPVDVVGGAVVKKSDIPMFNVKALPDGIRMSENGLIEVEAVGTGFLRISKRAMTMVSGISEPYRKDGKESRMVFDLKIVDGELISEDNVFCHKWRSFGEKVWVDPSITCAHIGVKKYEGSLLAYLADMAVMSAKEKSEEAAVQQSEGGK